MFVYNPFAETLVFQTNSVQQNLFFKQCRRTLLLLGK